MRQQINLAQPFSWMLIERSINYNDGSFQLFTSWVNDRLIRDTESSRPTHRSNKNIQTEHLPCNLFFLAKKHRFFVLFKFLCPLRSSTTIFIYYFFMAPVQPRAFKSARTTHIRGTFRRGTVFGQFNFSVSYRLHDRCNCRCSGKFTLHWPKRRDEKQERHTSLFIFICEELQRPSGGSRETATVMNS